jgi:hypothetical protein
MTEEPVPTVAAGDRRALARPLLGAPEGRFATAARGSSDRERAAGSRRREADPAMASQRHGGKRRKSARRAAATNGTAAEKTPAY